MNTPALDHLKQNHPWESGSDRAILNAILELWRLVEAKLEQRPEIEASGFRSAGHLLTLSEAITIGRRQKRAFRDPRWPDGLYAYHGMNNCVCFSDGREFGFSIAAVSHPIYELCDEPYHGPKLPAEPAAPPAPVVKHWPAAQDATSDDLGDDHAAGRS